MVLASFVVLGKLTQLQPQNPVISGEEELQRDDTDYPPSLTTRLWASSGDKLGNTMAINNAEYHIFYNLASRDD